MDFDSDGVRLHFELNGPERGTPLVAVHGFASDYQLNWVGSRWQETLTNAGFRVIGLDCRGHGHSDKPHDPAAYAVEIMAADVMRLLDHIDVRSAAYLGYSMGSHIGLQVLMSDPQRITRSVLGGVGGLVDMSEADAREIAEALRGIDLPKRSPLAQFFYRFAAGRPINDLEALAACIIGLQPHESAEGLASIRTPVLVVDGDRDPAAEEAPALVEAIPTSRLVIIPGRDHMSAVPARDFKRAALEFLIAE